MQESTARVATRQPESKTYAVSGGSAASAGAIPISLARVGQTGRVVRISGSAEVKKFLSDIGFTVGVMVSAVSDLKGSKILSVRGSKVAIDSTMASKIMFCPE